MERMPTFLIIGAAKSGTTSLYHYLGQHPDVYFSPVKEPAYFSRGTDAAVRSPIGVPLQVVDDHDSYRSLFNGAAEQARVAGEASTVYLTDPVAAERIRRHSSEMRLIVILRDPIKRCHSEYWMFRRDSKEPRTFETVVDDELNAPSINPVGYLGRGLYAKQLRHYLEHFDRSQIKIILFDDLCADPIGVVQSLLRFLGIDGGSFSPDISIKWNASGQPAHNALKPLLGKSPITGAIRRALPDCLANHAAKIQERWRSRALTKPPLEAEHHARLAAFYRDDVDNLQDLLERDLGHWLETTNTQ